MLFRYYLLLQDLQLGLSRFFCLRLNNRPAASPTTLAAAVITNDTFNLSGERRKAAVQNIVTIAVRIGGLGNSNARSDQ